MVVFLFLVGLIFGSFINALVWRLRQQLDDDGTPHKLSVKRQKELSITRGRSMCPVCKHQLSGFDLIPVLSWVSLRGRCRYCQKPISPQYPVVELLTGILFAITYWFWPFQVTGVEWFALVGFLVALVCLISLALYDWHWRILPTRLIYMAGVVYGLGLLLTCFMGAGYDRFIDAISGAGVYFVIFLSIFMVSDLMKRRNPDAKEWLGFGDVRLSFVLGLVAGSSLNVFLAMFIASMLGLVCTAPSLLSRKATMRSQIPFGPFLIVGAWVAFLWGGIILNGYTGLLDSLLM